MQRPTFGAVPARSGFGSVQDLALSAIKAGQVAAAGERGPDDAIRIDIDSARCVTDRATAGFVERRLITPAAQVAGMIRTILPGIGAGMAPHTLPSVGCGITL